MSRSGPRRVAVAGGILYGSGVMLASLSDGHLGALYLTYGKRAEAEAPVAQPATVAAGRMSALGAEAGGGGS